MDKHTYASAGVDIRRAESFVERLKKKSLRAGHKQLWKGAGGYACVYPITEQTGVALTTDGVGTKLLVACQLDKHDTIGIDLVAMCANDLICVGARPTVFLDYYAIGKLNDKQADAVITGIVEGCDQAGMILAGGETAEMPDLYGEDHYDLAGFALGEVSKERLLTGEGIKPGNKLIGVASSGIHSNGLSLARKLLAGKQEFLEQLLTPTLIYVKPVVELIESGAVRLNGLAHITGGGWRNLLRLSDQVGYHVEKPLSIPPIFNELGKSVAEEEMYKTFNMGMGLCVIVEDASEAVLNTFRKHGFTAQEVGVVTDKKNELTLSGTKVSFTE